MTRTGMITLCPILYPFVSQLHTSFLRFANLSPRRLPVVYGVLDGKVPL